MSSDTRILGYAADVFRPSLVLIACITGVVACDAAVAVQQHGAQSEAGAASRPDSAPLPVGFGVAGGDVAESGQWYYTWHYRHGPDYAKPGFLPMIGLIPQMEEACGWAAQSASGQAPEPICSLDDLQLSVDTVASFVNEEGQSERKGRVWLVFNEPDNSYQAGHHPRDAARFFYLLHQTFRGQEGIDPDARFYCCGTHPGFKHPHNWTVQGGETCEELDWMAAFAEELTRLNQLHKTDVRPDGVHYHSYHYSDWRECSYRAASNCQDPVVNPSEEATCLDRKHDGLRDGQKTIAVMEQFYQAMQLQPVFAELPILITEWSTLLSDEQANREIMHQVGSYLNQHAESINHVGAGWFVSQTDAWYWEATSLYHQDGSPTALGREYSKYRWGEYPKDALSQIYLPLIRK